VTVFVTEQGYFKKITPLSLRNSGEQKLKEGDRITASVETTNRAELLFFSDQAQVYKARCAAFADGKVSVMGDYIPSKLGFDDGEGYFDTVVTEDFAGFLIFIFENGKVAKVNLESYMTLQNRKKLLNAYSSKSKLIRLFAVRDNTEIMLTSNTGKSLIFNTGMLAAKASKNTDGVQVMSLKNKGNIIRAEIIAPEDRAEFAKIIVKNIPAAGFATQLKLEL
jgi:DNA gyrase subunit A